MGRKLTTEEFISKAKIVHGSKYNYSKVVYSGNKNKVSVMCPKHGEFNQRPNDHLNGNGCPKCGAKSCRDKFKSNTNEFINKAKLVHGNYYDYTKVEYHNSKTKVIITCPNHGDFKQIPNSHLNKRGCPTCKTSKGELNIEEFMVTNDIKYIKQHKFDDCRYIRRLPFDFYLPEFNTCIEYNGRQHYEPVTAFGGEEGFNLVILRDSIKTKYCSENDISLLTIKYNEPINEILSSVLL